MIVQQRRTFRRGREVGDHRAKMKIGQRQVGADEESVGRRQRLERGQDLGSTGEATLDLCLIGRLADRRPEHAMGEDLAHQRPVTVGIDHADDLIHAGQGARRAGLQGGAGEAAVEVAGDGAGFVEDEIVVNQGRHPAERMEGEIGRRDVGGERVHFDPLVGHPLLGQGEADDAEVDAVAITVQDQRHSPS